MLHAYLLVSIPANLVTFFTHRKCICSCNKSICDLTVTVMDEYFFLPSDTGSLPLPWSIRMKIALGAAKGLAFLHEEAERPVIYRDFKTSNILLDVVCTSCWSF